MPEPRVQTRRWSPSPTFGALKQRTYPPSAALKPFIQSFWTVQCEEDGLFTLKLFANGVSGIIVQHQNGSSALKRRSATQRSCGDDVPIAFVYGKRTKPGELVARGPFELTGVVFRPQTLHALLDTNPAEFNDGPVSVDDLFGGLQDHLLNASSAHDRLAILDRHLRTRVNDKRSTDVLTYESAQLLQAQVRIPEVLKTIRLSERQFEKRFKRAIGLSPHLYRRILRFQDAVRCLRGRQFEKMTDLAATLGYADQSHFIKEIREFAGCTPTALSEIVRASLDIPCASILSSLAECSLPRQELIDQRFDDRARAATS
jgi:AraC-like DNA-binding protein